MPNSTPITNKQQQTVDDCGGGCSQQQQQNSATSYGSIGPSSLFLQTTTTTTTNNCRPVTPSLHVELVNDDGGTDELAIAATPSSSAIEVIRSYDDLSVQDLVAAGHFGGSRSPGQPATAPIRLLRRRPSIFRRCYSSESNVLIPVHPSSNQQQQHWSWSAAAAAATTTSTSASVANSSHPQHQLLLQLGDSDVLVDCLPPYYWEAKHMPKLVKVRIILTTFFLSLLLYLLPRTRCQNP